MKVLAKIVFSVIGLSTSLFAQEWVNLWTLDLSQLSAGDEVTTSNTNINYVSKTSYTHWVTVDDNGTIGITAQKYADGGEAKTEEMALSANYANILNSKLAGAEFGKTVIRLSGHIKTNTNYRNETWTGFIFIQTETGNYISASNNTATLWRFSSVKFYNHSGSGSGAQNSALCREFSTSGEQNIKFEFVMDTTNQGDESEWFWTDIVVKSADTDDILLELSGYLQNPSKFEEFSFDRLGFGNYLYTSQRGNETTGYYQSDKTGATIYGLSIDAYNIPEPSTYAVFAGLIVLSFVTYRKRK